MGWTARGLGSMAQAPAAAGAGLPGFILPPPTSPTHPHPPNVAGEKIGQAALLPEWVYEDGTKGGLAAEAGGTAAGAAAAASTGPPPTPEALAAAEAAVAAQAAAVRELKEGRGLSNSSPEVQAAVEELQQRKAAAAALQAAAAGA